MSPSSLRFGVFEVDPGAGELRKKGLRVKLQAQPFKVLLLLLERAGEIVTREELHQHLWPSDTFVDFDRNLNKAVRKIREALGDNADTPRFIETLPRRGYRFLAPVEASAVTAPSTPVGAGRIGGCCRTPGPHLDRNQACAGDRGSRRRASVDARRSPVR